MTGEEFWARVRDRVLWTDDGIPRGHCGIGGCLCVHDCDHGWVELPPNVRTERNPAPGQTPRCMVYRRSAPCPICRPAAFDRLNPVDRQRLRRVLDGR